MLCLAGFFGRNFTFTFPPLLHLNVDGHLPDLTFKEDSSTFQIIIYTCYKEASGEYDDRVSSWESPFILLPGFNTMVGLASGTTKKCFSGL